MQAGFHFACFTWETMSCLSKYQLLALISINVCNTPYISPHQHLFLFSFFLFKFEYLYLYIYLFIYFEYPPNPSLFLLVILHVKYLHLLVHDALCVLLEDEC